MICLAEKGVIQDGEELGVYSLEANYRLDIGRRSTVNTAMTTDTWSTIFYIVPLDGSSDVRYNQAVKIVSASNPNYRLDIGPAASEKTHDSWATMMTVKVLD